MTMPLWGPSFSDDAIEREIDLPEGFRAKRFDRFDDLVIEAARRLSEQQACGWFQGPMEFGPRALGNRSILADPRPVTMRERINMIIKKREGFRPFAPAVTKEAARTYFEINEGDEDTFAHMLYVTRVRPEFRDAASGDYARRRISAGANGIEGGEPTVLAAPDTPSSRSPVSQFC